MRAMKDSGIEWIGEIPNEWKTIRLRSIFKFGKGLPITKADLIETGVPVISYGQIHSKDNIGTTVRQELLRYVDEEFLNSNEASLVYKGDFIFADTSEDLLGCGNCVYVDVDYPVFAGYHTMILRPVTTTSTKFYSYLFATDAWRSQIRTVASGVKLLSITQKMLRDTMLIEPSEEEKNKIVEFLDVKCAEIDALIAAKEKTNELLKEQRQSIIFEAVTKGLNSDAPMKDSGSDWILKIPEAWNTVKLSYLFDKIGSGTTPSSANSEYYDGDLNWLQTGDLNDKTILSTSKTITQKAINDYSALTLFKKGTLVIAMYGATIGKLGILGIDSYTNQACCALEDPKNAVSKYIYYWLQGNKDNIVRLSLGGGQPNISQSIISELKVTIPSSITEQENIVKYLDKKCDEIDVVIEANNTSVKKLKEYRQSIIYEAVTGKIEI